MIWWVIQFNTYPIPSNSYPLLEVILSFSWDFPCQERQENLSLAVDGQRHFAVLSGDGRKMRWADGDEWLRAESWDPEEQAFQEVVKNQCLRPA